MPQYKPSIRALALAVALLAAASGPVLAHPSRNTLVAAGEARYRPGAHPDRIVLLGSEDPARAQAVAWRTGPAVGVARAQLARATGSPGLHLSAVEVTGTTRALAAGNGPAHHHVVQFADLQPDTLYAYRVRGDGTWSEWLQFRTAPARFQPFEFLYFGDAQNSIRSHFSRVIREASREAPRAAFMLHTGDLADLREGNHDDQWGEWFEAGGFLHGMIPSLPVAGNHEYPRSMAEDGMARRTLVPHWPVQFPVPRNGPPGLQDTVYYVRYPGLLVVVLDSTRALDDPAAASQQAQWLDKVLAQNEERWTVVGQHHPMFSAAMERDNAALREAWEPVFERHGVDLVLQGHDHVYGRGDNVPAGSTVVAARGGPVYVVSVAGPKMYRVPDSVRESMQRTGEDVQLYQVIRVEADRLRFEARTAAGQLYDAFDIEKKRDGRKRVVERLPAGAAESRCSNPEPPRSTRCWEGTELVD